MATNSTFLVSMPDDLARAKYTLSHIFDHYPIIYIISLSRRSDRRKRVISQLSQFGIDMEEHGIKFFDALAFEDAGGFPSASVRGCFSSHRELMRLSENSGQRILVMEDDIFFNLRALASAENKLEELCQPSDLTYYGWLSADPDPADPNFENTIGGHFYGVSPTFAAEMRNFMDSCAARSPGSPDGGPMYRDAAFNFYRKRMACDRNVVIVRPSLAQQFSSKSDLSQKLWDHAPGIRDLLRYGRDLRNVFRR